MKFVNMSYERRKIKMKKILKKGALALAVAMLLSGISAFAANTGVINPVDINETYDTKTLTDWEVVGGADCYVDDEGRLAMKFKSWNTEFITKKIDNANLNAFVNFDFLMLNKNDNPQNPPETPPIYFGKSEA